MITVKQRTIFKPRVEEEELAEPVEPKQEQSSEYGIPVIINEPYYQLDGGVSFDKIRTQYRHICSEFIKGLKNWYKQNYPGVYSKETNWQIQGVMIDSSAVPNIVPDIEWHPLYLSLENTQYKDLELKLEPPPGKIIIPCSNNDQNSLVEIVIAIKDSENRLIFYMENYIYKENEEYKIPEKDIFKRKSSEGVNTILEAYQQQLVYGTQTSLSAVKINSITFTLAELNYAIAPPKWPVRFFNSEDLNQIYYNYLEKSIDDTVLLPSIHDIHSTSLPMSISQKDPNKPKNNTNCIIS